MADTPVFSLLAAQGMQNFILSIFDRRAMSPSQDVLNPSGESRQYRPTLKQQLRLLQDQLNQSKSEHDARLREAETMYTKKHKELEEVQARLVQEQQQLAVADTEIRKTNEVLQRQNQEMRDLQADRDRLQAIVEDRSANRLLTGGINIQAAFPTLPEIESSIRRALSVTVSEWIEEAAPALPPAIHIPTMLSRVFVECQELVGGIVQMHTSFMEGGAGRDGEAGTIDEATADMFRQHIRRHHRGLFPLAGEQLQSACTRVISKLGYSLAYWFPDIPPSKVGEKLLKTKLDQVVAEYLPILVGAQLQYPCVAFFNGCGTQQVFDAAIHAESIDGAAIEAGQLCFVVFPSTMVDHEGGQGFQPLSKSYILPC
eukprot:g2081.t1